MNKYVSNDMRILTYGCQCWWLWYEIGGRGLGGGGGGGVALADDYYDYYDDYVTGGCTLCSSGSSSGTQSQKIHVQLKSTKKYFVSIATEICTKILLTESAHTIISMITYVHMIKLVPICFIFLNAFVDLGLINRLKSAIR